MKALTKVCYLISFSIKLKVHMLSSIHLFLNYNCRMVLSTYVENMVQLKIFLLMITEKEPYHLLSLKMNCEYFSIKKVKNTY